MTALSASRLPRNSLDDAVIIEAALDAVAELGVDSLTVPAVAKRIGVRPTAVYWHFRRKEDLLGALDAYALQRFNSLFPPLPDRSWRDNVRAYWTEYRRILRENPASSSSSAGPKACVRLRRLTFTSAGSTGSSPG
jgi:AcrR family transcriptional regulator